MICENQTEKPLVSLEMEKKTPHLNPGATRENCRKINTETS